MPQYVYRGRDKNGHLRSGVRFAATVDNLNVELINEGIFPFEIIESQIKHSVWETLQAWIQGKGLHREELAIFSRQMKLLHQAGVPMVTAFKQLGEHTRSKRLAHALEGVIEYLEKGQSLAIAMEQYPTVFSPLVVNLIRIGENTGRLSESFDYIHQYLEFETNNAKQIKAAFRYPVFVFISMIVSIIILNIFVIPTFGKFYVNLTVALPWQTELLIGTSNFIVHYGLYLLIIIIAATIMTVRYLHTPEGRYRWDKLLLRIPVVGKLLKRIIVIRFSQSLAIMLGAGLSVPQAFGLIKDIIQNTYISKQITNMQEMIERGTPFTQALSKMELFTSLEIQILAVGETNGELSPALQYIANFHSQEIEFDLKRMNDLIGPIMIAAVSGLILIVALGVYLPIWNMINLVH